MRSNDDSQRRPAQTTQRAVVDLRLSLSRGETILPLRGAQSGAGALAANEIVDAARAVGGRPGALLVGGGEVIARPDSLELLGELARLRPAQLGVCASGPGLSPAVVRRLAGA